MFVRQKAKQTATGIQPSAQQNATCLMNLKNAALIGLAAYWLLGKAGSAAYSRIKWSFEKVRIFKDVKLLKGGFNLRLRIINQLPTDISLAGYQGEILQNGSLVATIQNVSPINLPSGQEVVITAFAKVKSVGILQAIAKGELLAPVEIDSYAKFKLLEEEFELPVTNTITLFHVE